MSEAALHASTLRLATAATRQRIALAAAGDANLDRRGVLERRREALSALCARTAAAAATGEEASVALAQPPASRPPPTPEEYARLSEEEARVSELLALGRCCAGLQATLERTRRARTRRLDRQLAAARRRLLSELTAQLRRASEELDFVDASLVETAYGRKLGDEAAGRDAAAADADAEGEGGVQHLLGRRKGACAELERVASLLEEHFGKRSAAAELAAEARRRAQTAAPTSGAGGAGDEALLAPARAALRVLRDAADDLLVARAAVAGQSASGRGSPPPGPTLGGLSRQASGASDAGSPATPAWAASEWPVPGLQLWSPRAGAGEPPGFKN